MLLKPGARLRATTTRTEVLVVRAPEHDIVLSCAGGPMGPASGPAPATRAASGIVGDDAILLGKRYAGGGVELLCVVAGAGPLRADGDELTMQEARALPASD
jgi:hypothetical protein